MKTKKILSALMLILMALFVMQCEKGGVKPDRVDDDSDRPEWAGGGDGVNPHQNPNPSPGISKGGDYGDLYELWRTVDGVPILIEIPFESDVWYVQPVDVNGLTLDLNEEGELENPELALSVEFGRLNIVRSPPNVLDQAFDEAMKVLRPGDVPGRTIIEITLDFCGRLTSEYSDDGGITTIFKTIDSPRENMAIYKHIMNNMFDVDLAFLNAYSFDPLMIAASCFAAGSDKTGTVNLDEVVYINSFMECIGDEDEAIENPGEFDPEGNVREYFNFSTCSDYGNGPCEFRYNRNLYKERHIQFLVEGTSYFPVNENGYSEGPIYTIHEVMEQGGLFTSAWPTNTEYVTHVEGFALAIDDAVQVLDLIHGDSNIRSVPYSEENNPYPGP